MNQVLGNDRKIMLLSFATAGATVIAGILHLTMVPRSISHDLGEGILFLTGGIAQVFWAVPVIKRWGRIWQIIGIVGTAVFVISWLLSRWHLIPEGNVLGGSENIPSREFPRGNATAGDLPRSNMPKGIGIGGTALSIEVCQITFIGLYIVLSKMISNRQKNQNQSKDKI